MICKTLSITAKISLLDALGIQPELRGGMRLRFQVTSGTLLYGSNAAQLMTLAVNQETDLDVINAKDLHLAGTATVNVLVHYSND